MARPGRADGPALPRSSVGAGGGRGRAALGVATGLRGDRRSVGGQPRRRRRVSGAPGFPYDPDNWQWRAGRVDPGPAVVFDLDGVLSDAVGRQHYLERPFRDWEAF